MHVYRRCRDVILISIVVWVVTYTDHTVDGVWDEARVDGWTANDGVSVRGETKKLKEVYLYNVSWLNCSSEECFWKVSLNVSQCRINHAADVANATGLRGACGSRENFLSPSVVK